MFCSNCGKSIDDKAAVCIHCGAPTRNFSANGKAPVDPNEPADKLMIIVSVILPIVGIILGIMEKITVRYVQEAHTSKPVLFPRYALRRLPFWWCF